MSKRVWTIIAASLAIVLIATAGSGCIRSILGSASNPSPSGASAAAKADLFDYDKVKMVKYDEKASGMGMSLDNVVTCTYSRETYKNTDARHVVMTVNSDTYDYYYDVKTHKILSVSVNGGQSTDTLDSLTSYTLMNRDPSLYFGSGDYAKMSLCTESGKETITVPLGTRDTTKFYEKGTVGSITYWMADGIALPIKVNGTFSAGPVQSYSDIQMMEYQAV